MKNLLRISGLIIFSFMLNGCKKEVDNTIKDIDGNSYSIVTIGSQVWMKENLRTTRYRNGDDIGTTSTATLDINSETTPKYQWAYDGNEKTVKTYGRIYTWYAVTDSRNICPTGWHIPTYSEWETLIDYLANYDNGLEDSGSDIAKSLAAQSGWVTFPTSATIDNAQSRDRSGFSGLPGGYRNSAGGFNSIGLGAYWWSATETSTMNASSRSIRFSYTKMIKGNVRKHSGLTVRCLQD